MLIFCPLAIVSQGGSIWRGLGVVSRPEFRGFMNLARTGAGPVQVPENGSVQGQPSARTESSPRFRGGLGSLGDIGAGPVQVMPLGLLLCRGGFSQQGGDGSRWMASSHAFCRSALCSLQVICSDSPDPFEYYSFNAERGLTAGSLSRMIPMR